MPVFIGMNIGVSFVAIAPAASPPAAAPLAYTLGVDVQQLDRAGHDLVRGLKIAGGEHAPVERVAFQAAFDRADHRVPGRSTNRALRGT